jgi:SAM-dependent methyltransferase
LSISLHERYPAILARLKSSPEQKYLDLGCCFGQDIRKLVSDGVPSSQLSGCDLRAGFFELGYELFLDQETLESKFFEADVFAAANEDAGKALAGLDGKVDILYAGSFLHLFDWNGQVKVCERIVKLLRPVKDSVLLGRQVGGVIAEERSHRTNPWEKMYRHNKESFEKLWEEVGQNTGTSWRVEAELQGTVGQGEMLSGSMHDKDVRRLRFAVLRE